MRHTEIRQFKLIVAGGKGNILKRLKNYNEAVNHTSWFVVVDLDQDADCAPEHLRNLLPKVNKGMMLRVAVRSVEAWIMADRAMISQFLGVHASNIPLFPDTLDNPKAELIDLIDRKCKRNWIRKDMLPNKRGKRKVGTKYTDRMAEFVQLHWRPEVAARRSDSLARCIRALENLKRQAARRP